MSFKIRILILGLAVTFIPVNTVFAEDSEDFVACQQMKWKAGKKAKKNCFRDLARQRESELTSVPSEPQFLVDKNGKDTGFTSITDLCRGVVGISSVLKAMGGGDAKPLSYADCIVEAGDCIDSAAQLNPEHGNSVWLKANDAEEAGMAMFIVQAIIAEDNEQCPR